MGPTAVTVITVAHGNRGRLIGAHITTGPIPAPDRRGRIHDHDAASLAAFGSRVRELFAQNLAVGAQASGSSARGGSARFAPANLTDGKPDTYWATDDGIHQAEVVLDFPVAISFNIVSLREFLPLGQRVDRFAMPADDPERPRQPRLSPVQSGRTRYNVRRYRTGHHAVSGKHAGCIRL